MLRRDHDADEVVQEALARAWRNRGSCRTPEAPMPWCLQITRNEALRRLGYYATRGGGIPLDGLGTELPDQRAMTERDRVDDRIDIARALGRLTPDERLMISLRYDDDCSHPQIAERLQIPETTARVRLHRAHKRLKTLLEDRY
jgi:RNA polymerase sigma factor (sigma-70 family)